MKSFGKYGVAAVLFTAVALLLSACAQTSKTRVVTTPWPPNNFAYEGQFLERQILSKVGASCLSIVSIQNSLEKAQDEENHLLNFLVPSKAEVTELVGVIRKVLGEELVCPDKYEDSSDSLIVLRKETDKLYERFKTDHAGLFRDRTSTDTTDVSAEFSSAVRNLEGVSISLDRPGALSISARALPTEQEASGVFANLKERAQAALINYAGTYVKDPKDQAPEKAAKKLLENLGPPKEPAAIGDTQRVDLVISAALNSASTLDRFDYLTAYILIPPLPGPVSSDISLENKFLADYSDIAFPRRKKEEAPGKVNEDINKDIKRFREFDLQRALAKLRVQISAVEPLNQIPAIIQLGTVKSTIGLSAEEARLATGALGLTKLASTMSAERQDNIAKELDKRTSWINDTRNMLRITQRGLSEATISGSIANSITFNVPKIGFHIMRFQVDDNLADGDEKSPRLFNVPVLQDVKRPVFGEIDAVALVVGTVRVSESPGLQNRFQKEPDGTAYTLVERPIPLRLWTNSRVLESVTLADINPGIKGADGVQLVRVLSSEPPIDQKLVFQDREAFTQFLSFFVSEKKKKKHKQLRLETVEVPDTVKKAWCDKVKEACYELVSCSTKYEPSPARIDAPAIQRVWLRFPLPANGSNPVPGFMTSACDPLEKSSSEKPAAKPAMPAKPRAEKKNG